MWGVVACCSFASDYLLTGQRDAAWKLGWHLADRWAAATCFAVCLCRLPFHLLAGWQPGLLAAGGGLLAAACLYRSRTAKAYEEHETFHALWHLFGAGTRLLLAVMFRL